MPAISLLITTLSLDVKFPLPSVSPNIATFCIAEEPITSTGAPLVDRAEAATESTSPSLNLAE